MSPVKSQYKVSVDNPIKGWFLWKVTVWFSGPIEDTSDTRKFLTENGARDFVRGEKKRYDLDQI